MFKTIIYSIFLFIGISVSAQEAKGINFQNVNLEEAKKIAQKENKLIFIDLFTTWCGPCKLMKKNTFPDEKLGEFFNEHFVNLAIDAENNKEGIELVKKFRITNYPSFLFLDGKGKLVQYDFGYYNAQQFLQVGNAVLQKSMTSKKPKSAMKAIDQVKGKMVGDKIKNFTAKDQFGESFSLNNQKQKIILVFIRGQWCPYCNQYVKDLQDLSPELQNKNAKLVIISPEKPEFIEKTIEKTNTKYTVLYDEGYKIAEAFDVLYTPDQKTLEFYNSKLKDDFANSRSDQSGRLPVSATFILNENKEITWRHFDPDYKVRASTVDILSQL
ncbi:redoxin domain-containing protein [Chryseobacterium turcicum]|uniref:Redoxin domain-containing protein n=1 Tax=Chryseobacterium turcicum TaxID=2898076 RepID=A0A9Q3YY48_9FLAO|nr:redoxin domain-containing protein [Chryseobacterium turcicum]MCD1115890.1 redoxin domain-containing protein [Chryseobacterium turcicum]